MREAEICPCGTGRRFAECCQPRHDGTRAAETPEALMRSRYSAFALANGPYLHATSRVPMGDDVEAWARSVTWVGLEVLRAEGTVVEFRATCLEGGFLRTTHEASSFEHAAGRWLYVGGEPTVTRTKLERNEPCPCGSGRKFKQCHA